MVARGLRLWALPLLLVAGLSACASNAVSPGVIQTSSAQRGQPQPQPGVGEAGRVVSVREIDLKGAGSGARPNQGTLWGGMLGSMGGGILGATIQSGGGLVGALLGAVGGAVVGTILANDGNVGRGIEVIVQKDDGQTLTIAQRDDGDVQLGDRVVVVADRNGVAKAVRDTTQRSD
jgi:outer membrane lipoprotein SlyB